jgi:hypothetical protein
VTAAGPDERALAALAAGLPPIDPAHVPARAEPRVRKYPVPTGALQGLLPALADRYAESAGGSSPDGHHELCACHAGAARRTRPGHLRRRTDLYDTSKVLAKEGHVLVETKSPGADTPMDRILRRLGVRPLSLSKYCLAVPAPMTDPEPCLDGGSSGVRGISAGRLSPATDPAVSASCASRCSGLPSPP